MTKEILCRVQYTMTPEMQKDGGEGYCRQLIARRLAEYIVQDPRIFVRTTDTNGDVTTTADCYVLTREGFDDLVRHIKENLMSNLPSMFGSIGRGHLG